MVGVQLQRNDLVALHCREQRVHVHRADHLRGEVYGLAARRFALGYDERVAVRLDHLVFQAFDERLVIGV